MPLACSVCGKPSRYTCPRCAARTCSSACVDTHKTSLSCDGKRDVVKYLPVDTMNDTVLHSDYAFLEDAERTMEGAHRSLRHLGPGSRTLPTRLKLLLREARRRGVHLSLMPQGMQRRKENTSYFHVQKRSLTWRVEWHFHGTRECIVDPRLDESTLLSTCLARFLDPQPGNAPLRHRLAEFVHAAREDVCIFLRAERVAARHPCFFELSPSTTLGHSLVGRHIIEFPALYVALRRDAEFFPALPSSSSPPMVEKKKRTAQEIDDDEEEEEGDEEEEEEEKKKEEEKDDPPEEESHPTNSLEEVVAVALQADVGDRIQPHEN